MFLSLFQPGAIVAFLAPVSLMEPLLTQFRFLNWGEKGPSWKYIFPLGQQDKFYPETSFWKCGPAEEMRVESGARSQRGYSVPG